MKKVTVLDVETDDGGKVVLTILRSGGLSVQTFRASVSAQSLYRWGGAVTLDPEFIREWAETLREKTRRKESRQTRGEAGNPRGDEQATLPRPKPPNP